MFSDAKMCIHYPLPVAIPELGPGRASDSTTHAANATPLVHGKRAPEERFMHGQR